MPRRVVVTGLGIASCIGIGVEAAWDSAVNGRSGIRSVEGWEGYNLTGFRTKIAGKMVGFDPAKYIPVKMIKRLDPFCHFALAAAKMAVVDAGLAFDEAEGERVGVTMGCGLGGMNTIEAQHRVLLDRGPDRISPFFIPMVCPNMASGQIAITYGAKGPNTCVSTACAASNHAIGEAFRYIQHGYADVMFAGGVEAVCEPSGLAGFNALRALSTRNDEPEKASRPFDRERDGFVMAEGSGILILEELERARKCGARIYAELIGYGLSADAFHMTQPSPGGEGAARCMRLAVDDAKLNPQDVDYINAHGTSTPLNDTAETQAIKAVFGDHAYKLAVSSTKSMHGHMLGAAGGAEGVLMAKAIYHQIMPPTINLEYPDPECDLDYVPNVARPGRIRVALSNAFGFGGTNACIVMKRFDG